MIKIYYALGFIVVVDVFAFYLSELPYSLVHVVIFGTALCFLGYVYFRCIINEKRINGWSNISVMFSYILIIIPPSWYYWVYSSSAFLKVASPFLALVWPIVVLTAAMSLNNKSSPGNNNPSPGVLVKKIIDILKG